LEIPQFEILPTSAKSQMQYIILHRYTPN